jgi:hypothetical protein
MAFAFAAQEAHTFNAYTDMKTDYVNISESGFDNKDSVYYCICSFHLRRCSEKSGKGKRKCIRCH